MADELYVIQPATIFKSVRKLINTSMSHNFYCVVHCTLDIKMEFRLYSCALVAFLFFLHGPIITPFRLRSVTTGWRHAAVFQVSSANGRDHDLDEGDKFVSKRFHHIEFYAGDATSSMLWAWSWCRRVTSRQATLASTRTSFSPVKFACYSLRPMMPRGRC